MSVFRNGAGEVRLAWRLLLVVLLFVASAVFVRLLPIRWYAARLVGNGMAQAEAAETARTAVFEDPVWSTAVGILNGLLGLLIVWFVIRAIERSDFSWEAIGLDWRRDSPLAIVCGALLAVGLFMATVWTGHILGFSAAPLSASLSALSIPTLLQLLVLYLAMGLGEEIVFRGYVQTRLVKPYGAIWGVLATAVLFTLLHQVSYQLSPVVILSGVMLWTAVGALYHWSRSMYLVGVFHGTMNTLLNALPFEPGDISNLVVNALVLCLAIVVALVRTRSSGTRSDPV
jgi:membrane protease YdiL (CAAX protease family)